MQEIYKKSDDFVYRKIAGETILVPIRKAIKNLQSIYSLNETACRIWENIDGKHTLDKIIQSVESEYEIDKNTLEQDIKYILERLRQIGAIKCVS